MKIHEALEALSQLRQEREALAELIEAAGIRAADEELADEARNGFIRVLARLRKVAGEIDEEVGRITDLEVRPADQPRPAMEA